MQTHSESADARRVKTLERLLETTIAIMAEPDVATLLGRVVLEARRCTNAEAGTLFIREGAFLDFSIVQNDHLERVLGPGGLKGLFENARLAVHEPSLASYVAQHGQVLNLPDVYTLTADAPYRFDAAWDAKNYYRTRSMLVVPLMDRAGNNLGVLELINARDERGESVAFPASDEPIVRALAAHAALALENARLTELSFVDALT